MDDTIRPTRRITRHHLTHPGQLVGLLVGRCSPRRIKVDYRLRFLHEVFKFEYFPYGLWDRQELTIEGLKSAQEGYPRALRPRPPAVSPSAGEGSPERPPPGERGVQGAPALPAHAAALGIDLAYR